MVDLTVSPTHAPAVVRVEGFDVSHHQNAIDWARIPRQQIEFCFVKTTDGATGRDNRFDFNWKGARSAGLIRGAYHFFRTTSTPSDQLSNFIEMVGDLDIQDLPPVLDLEIPQDDLPAWKGIAPNRAIDMAMDWLTGAQAYFQRTPIVYTNREFVLEVLGGNPGALNGYPLWLAHFTKADAPLIPSGWDTWRFWQYFNKGKLAGFDQKVDVDMNRFNGSLQDLMTFIDATVVVDD